MEQLGTNLKRYKPKINTGLYVRVQKKQTRLFIDNEFLELGVMASLKPSTVCVYIVLCKYANFKNQSCFPGMSTIMKQSGIGSKSTVIKGIGDLEKLNLISVDRSGYSSNTYYLLAPLVWNIKKDTTQYQNIDHSSTNNGTLTIISNTNKRIDDKRDTKKTQEELDKVREKLERAGILSKTHQSIF